MAVKNVLNYIRIFIYYRLNSRPQCKTVSGPRVGSVCVFPFTFYNLTFTECTDFWHAPGGGDTLYWCATSSNPETDNWGFCGQHCSNSSHLNTVTTTTSTTAAVTSTASDIPESTTSSSASQSQDPNESTESSESLAPETSSAHPEGGQNGSESSEAGVDENSPQESTTDTSDIGSLGRDFPGGAGASSCHTVSGPAPGLPCTFPFSHQGRTYAGCTVTWRTATPWCSTHTDAQVSQFDIVM